MLVKTIIEVTHNLDAREYGDDVSKAIAAFRRDLDKGNLSLSGLIYGKSVRSKTIPIPVDKKVR